jgi:hypothetical protein
MLAATHIAQARRKGAAMDKAKDEARHVGNRGTAAPVARPGKPAAGYADPAPKQQGKDAQPDPNAAGSRKSQVAANTHPRAPAKPGEPEEPAMPGSDEPVPPGEHKREPIEDPDPADTKMYVRSGSR